MEVVYGDLTAFEQRTNSNYTAIDPTPRHLAIPPLRKVRMAEWAIPTKEWLVFSVSRRGCANSKQVGVQIVSWGVCKQL